MDMTQNPLDHETLSTCGHVGGHLDFSFIQFFWISCALKIYFKVNLDRLGLLDQSHDLYITSQAPSSSSIKRLPSIQGHRQP